MKCEEGGNCNVKISAQVKRGPVHLHKLMRTKEIYSDKVWDCAGKKSIFSANHILIIAYGQIALLLASINLICQVWTAQEDKSPLGHVPLSIRECFFS